MNLIAARASPDVAPTLHDDWIDIIQSTKRGSWRYIDRVAYRVVKG
jgi:hypothetical protein